MICFACGIEYRWVYKANKWHALNVADDANHWAGCPGGRKKRASRNCNARSVTQRIDSLPGRVIVGERYRPPCGKCSDIPPWEPCDCSEQFLRERDERLGGLGAEAFNAAADARLQLALIDA